MNIVKLFSVLLLVAGTASLPSVADGSNVDWSAAERVSDGIAFVRMSYEQPRLMKAQAMRVDLSDKSLFFTANGRDKRWGKPMPYYTNLVVRTRRITVEEFMMNARAPTSLGGRGLDMLVAFNTALWTPCPEPIPTPYAQTHGLNISDGVVVSSEHSDRVKGIFAIWKNGGADILPTPLDPARIPDAWIAHSGWAVVLKDGKPLFKPENDDSVHPRTALGLSKDRRWLYILVVEGRHEGVSIGADYWDLANIMLSLGASDAVNMDGGGSTALVRWDEKTQRQVTCLTQDVPPRRDALSIGICRRHAPGDALPPLDADRLYDAAIDADIERSASLFHHYEFNDVKDTPPPDGYRPFYLSHYGRHGSRYQRSENDLNACVVMKAAQKADVLTDPGKALLRRLRALHDAHKGMYEALSIRGAEEQKRLAQRMHDRFPGVFSGGRVRCQSSTFHRCLSSMANFTCSLKGAEPKLDFAFETGDRCMARVFPNLYGSGDTNAKEAYRKRMDDVKAALLRRFVDPNRLMQLLFTDDPAVKKLVKDPYRFAQDLFFAASTFQTLERELDGVDIYDFFTRDERLALARYQDCRYYVGMCNSEEFGARNLRGIRVLLADIIERADEVLKDGGVCADLRFGHDSALMPLLCLLGVDGLGAHVPAAEAWKVCPHWKYMPMAANLQIVFYRNDAGDCLVKILLNEREAVLSGVSPHIGPYYRWKDIKAHFGK